MNRKLERVFWVMGLVAALASAAATYVTNPSPEAPEPAATAEVQP